MGRERRMRRLRSMKYWVPRFKLEARVGVVGWEECTYLYDSWSWLHIHLWILFQKNTLTSMFIARDMLLVVEVSKTVQHLAVL